MTFGPFSKVWNDPHYKTYHAEYAEWLGGWFKNFVIIGTIDVAILATVLYVLYSPTTLLPALILYLVPLWILIIRYFQRTSYFKQQWRERRPSLILHAEAMGDAASPDISTATEIRAGLKPIAPWWQWILGLMFVVGGVGGFPAVEFSPWGVAFGILLLVGFALVTYYFARNKTVIVTMKPGDDCVLINDPTRPDLGKLVPSRVVQEDDLRVQVYREGKRTELKRMEFRFATAEDMSRVMNMFRRFLSKP